MYDCTSTVGGLLRQATYISDFEGAYCGHSVCCVGPIAEQWLWQRLRGPFAEIRRTGGLLRIADQKRGPFTDFPVFNQEIAAGLKVSLSLLRLIGVVPRMIGCTSYRTSSSVN